MRHIHVATQQTHHQRNIRVSYIVGMARNARLQQDAQQLQKQAKEWFELRGKKQRLFQDFVGSV